MDPKSEHLQHSAQVYIQLEGNLMVTSSISLRLLYGKPVAAPSGMQHTQKQFK